MIQHYKLFLYNSYSTSINMMDMISKNVIHIAYTKLFAEARAAR